VTFPDQTTTTQQKILYSRSSDAGVTWSPAVPLDPTDFINENVPQVAADSNGTWMVTYQATPIPKQGQPATTVVVRSTDNGVTWSSPEVISHNDAYAGIGTDDAGTWIVVANKNRGPIHSYVSTDSGDTWTTLGLVGNQGSMRSRVATDGVGNWVTVSDGYLAPSQQAADVLYATAFLPPNSANLALTQGHSPSGGPLPAGSQVTFELQVRNLGPEPATGVVLSDTFTGDFRVTNIVTSLGTGRVGRGNRVYVEIPEIPAGATVDVQISGKIWEWSTRTELTAQAYVTLTELDPDTSDNSASETIEVFRGQPDLIVSVMEPGVTPIRRGSRLTWYAAVSNPANGAARPTVTRFYLSSDATLSPDDRLIKTAYQGPIGIYTYSPSTAYSAFLRGPIPKGSCVIGVADANKTVAESNEDNNVSAAMIGKAY
jgi:hypothetical protein